jgi:CheY-like chemotaxis protein
VAEGTAVRGPAIPDEPDLPLETGLIGLKVLVVDDDPDALVLLTALLRLCGAAVRPVRSASETLDALQVWTPDVLLIDLVMPHEDGYALLAEVRQRPGRVGRLGAIAITGYPADEQQERVLTAGFARLLTKPIDILELVAALRPFRPPPAGDSGAA